MDADAVTTQPPAEQLSVTPLHALHIARGGRMVPFAGYSLPVQYADGIIAEHNHTRSAAGLFDVSHMGQAFLVGPDHDTIARALEALAVAAEGRRDFQGAVEWWEKRAAHYVGMLHLACAVIVWRRCVIDDEADLFG